MTTHNAAFTSLFTQELAADLQQIIRLHDRELDAETVAALQAVDFPHNLALLPVDDMGLAAQQLMQECLPQISAPTTPPPLDVLAADFAAIYLTAAHGTSPYESVWVLDERLTAQQPMFEWREIYKKDQLEVGNWRARYDDHIVLEMQWLAHRLLKTPENWQETAHLLDEHLLFWLPDWAARVQARADTAFYVALAGLSLSWLRRFRQLLAEHFALAIPERASIAEKIRLKYKAEREQTAPIKFMPGAQGPSW